jgi:hypothetical protein
MINPLSTMKLARNNEFRPKLYQHYKGPLHSAYSIAEVTGVSYSIIIHDLLDSLGMKLFHLRQVPHELTPDLRHRQLKI